MVYVNVSMYKLQYRVQTSSQITEHIHKWNGEKLEWEFIPIPMAPFQFHTFTCISIPTTLIGWHYSKIHIMPLGMQPRIDMQILGGVQTGHVDRHPPSRSQESKCSVKPFFRHVHNYLLLVNQNKELALAVNVINVKKLPYKFNIIVRVQMTHLKRQKYFVRIE